MPLVAIATEEREAALFMPIAVLAWATNANHAPKWRMIGKRNIFKSSCLEHAPHLLLGESFFQRCAKPIVGIGSHHVEGAVFVKRQRSRARQHPDRIQQ